jgi:hypothetical protein
MSSDDIDVTGTRRVSTHRGRRKTSQITFKKQRQASQAACKADCILGVTQVLAEITTSGDLFHMVSAAHSSHMHSETQVLQDIN